MSDKLPASTDGSGFYVPGSVWGALAFGIGCAYLVRLGYKLGINQSNIVLKCHNKDVKRMYKREKEYFKEQKEKEKEHEKNHKIKFL